MFRDQKNINVRVIGWLLLAIFAANMHYLCVFIYLDVFHLNWVINIPDIKFNDFCIWNKCFDMPEWYFNPIIINDIFPFFNAPKDIHLDIQYYLYFVGIRLTVCILSYLLLSAVKALNILCNTYIKELNYYKKIYLFIKAYLLVNVYGLVSYVLFAGQVMRGVPLLIICILILIIFFIHKDERGWRIKAEL